MRLFIIDHFAGGPELGSRWHTWRLAKDLQERGVVVTVLTADFSHKRRHNLKVEHDFEETKIGDVPYCFVGTPSYDNTLGGRGRNITTFLRKSWLAARTLAQKYTPDVILCASAYPFDYYVAKRITRYHRAKIIFELQEIWPVMMQELWGYNNDEILVKASESALNKALSASDRVLGVLPQGICYLEEHGISTQKYQPFAHPADLTPKSDKLPKRKKEFAQRIRSNHSFLIVYQGFVAEEKCLNTLIAAAATLEESGVGVLICGNGGYKIQLKRVMREHDADNVYLMDRIEPEETTALYQMADCLFLGDSRSSAAQYGFVSSKLLEYMLAAKPVLCVTAASQSAATQSGCGINVEENSPRALAAAIQKLLQMPPEARCEMGRKGPDWIRKHHNPAVLGEQIYDCMKELIDG